MSALRAAAWFGTMLGIAGGSGAAWAQTQPAATSYGPGRIVCGTGMSCELGIGTPASLKYKIDPSALPAADKDRLTRQCTAKGTPCVATVTGTEDRNVVKAASIKFHN
jgi:hypothetical protein